MNETFANILAKVLMSSYANPDAANLASSVILGKDHHLLSMEGEGWHWTDEWKGFDPFHGVEQIILSDGLVFTRVYSGTCVSCDSVDEMKRVHAALRVALQCGSEPNTLLRGPLVKTWSSEFGTWLYSNTIVPGSNWVLENLHLDGILKHTVAYHQVIG